MVQKTEKKDDYKPYIYSMIHSPGGPFIISLLLAGIIYVLSQLPYTNLLFQVGIAIGLYWLGIVLIYRMSVRITLFLAAGMWGLALLLVLVGMTQPAEILSSNVLIILIVAFIQQIAAVRERQ